jgi:hypothetical protein
MRLQGLALAALMLAGLLATPAYADSLDPTIIPGIVFSAGRSDTRRNDTGLGSGYFLDANYTRTFVNGGGGYQGYGNIRVLNTYLGVGIGKILQVQAGYGNDGVVQRIRSDTNLTSLYDFFTGTKRGRYNRTLGNRLTFTVSLEDYKSHPRLDNLHIGLGLLY